MNSGRIKWGGWVLCLLSAALLCLGLYTGQENDRGVAGTTHPVTIAASEWVENTVFRTEWSREETVFWAETVVPEGMDEPGAVNPALPLVLFALGAVLGVCFLLRKGPPVSWLCPELETLLAVPAGCLAVYLSWLRSPVLLVPGIALMALALGGLGSLVRRLRRGLRLEETGANRLGRRAAGADGSARRYALVQLLLAGSCLMCAGGLLVLALGLPVWPMGLAGAVCFLYALVPAACWLRLGRDTDGLTEQIRRLHEGEPVTPREGFFARDIQTLGDLQSQRDRAVQTAVTGERFKVELISNVSHDLRTPLTAILGYGELLEGETLSEEGRTRLDLLNRKAGYMRDLVEELFELTKVSSGVVEPSLRELDLVRLLEQTLGLLDDRLRQSGLEVRRYYPEEPVPLVTDGSRMHQVFINLLENAVKYALTGTRIYLEVRPAGERVTVRLTNTASYDMDFRPEEIVQRFVRGDKARTSQGSGIGLAIAQTYTQSCGGEFRVEVDGDQFRAIVTLPLNSKADGSGNRG